MNHVFSYLRCSLSVVDANSALPRVQLKPPLSLYELEFKRGFVKAAVIHYSCALTWVSAQRAVRRTRWTRLGKPRSHSADIMICLRIKYKNMSIFTFGDKPYIFYAPFYAMQSLSGVTDQTNSDVHQISPNNIKTVSSRQIMRWDRNSSTRESNSRIRQSYGVYMYMANTEGLFWAWTGD